MTLKAVRVVCVHILHALSAAFSLQTQLFSSCVGAAMGLLGRIKVLLVALVLLLVLTLALYLIFALGITIKDVAAQRQQLQVRQWCFQR